jgi:glycosyltransferase involved in cell wall biosynthesis
VDWVYSPTETFCAARKARTAATIHCVNWFEPELPWHRTPENQAGRRQMEKVFHPIIHRADLIITVSEFAKRRICELFSVVPDRVAVVGNGAEECFFEAGRRADGHWNRPTDDDFLLAICYGIQRKGAHYLIRLADTLARQKSRLKIRIVGAGLAPNETLAMAEKRHGKEPAEFVAQALARPNVELLGYKHKEEVAELMRRSVAFLILGRYETFGIPAIEAMAAGVPVIAARFAALPEVAGGAALLVDAENADEIAQAATDLMTRPVLRERCIKAGLERAQEFTWERCAEKLVRAFARVSR